jgi:hypothetical protein
MAGSKTKLAELKTKQNDSDVISFLSALPDKQKKEDSLALLKMMKAVTRTEPKMWGGSIIGFGKYIYTSPATGRSGEWFMTGFSPRKQNLTIYIIPGFAAYSEYLKKLGKYKISGGSCLYINKLADVDMKILKDLISLGYKTMKEKYKPQKSTK